MMIVRPLSCMICVAVLLTLVGCSHSEAPAAANAPSHAAMATTAASGPSVADSACQASQSWITNPSKPSEVASSESFCDFYQFSWQWFLAEVSPSNPRYPHGDRVFETNRVVDPDGGSNQCAGKALTGRAVAATLLALRGPQPIDFESSQADGNPLYDQSRHVLYYNMWYSPEECQATKAGFVAGTFEIKTAWRVLPGPDPTYFTMNAILPSGSKPVVLGLVGFHLVNWTSKHPEFIWATFEHKSNAPLCDGSSATSGWSLASDPAAQCLAKYPAPSGSVSPNCASFNFNVASAVSTPPPPTSSPDEICRLFVSGNEPGKAINGNNNAANIAAIKQLNTALVGPNGMLTKLPASDPMAVWKNYEMIGALWTKNGAASGAPPIPSKQGPADPNSSQRGSLELTNMTMETFEQGPASFVPNCFGCHNYAPAHPLKVSHIADKFLLPKSVAAFDEKAAKQKAGK